MSILHLSAIDLLSSLPDGSVDMVLTDPPYGVAYNSGWTDTYGPIAGDKSLPTDWLSEAFRVLKPGSALYCFAHWKTWSGLYEAAERAEFAIKNMVVLRKSNHGMGDLKGAYAPKHELLLYATKGRHLLNWHDGRKTDIWDVPIIANNRRVHPCEKTSEWLLPAILHSTKPGDLVVDPFCGSGSVPLACVESGRRYLAGDIDERWVALANGRLAR